jgi:transmembrane sensor
MSLGVDDRQLARYLAGECDEDEARTIAAWLAADPDRLRQLEQLRRAWRAAGVGRGSFDRPVAWAKVMAKASARPHLAVVPKTHRDITWAPSRRRPMWARVVGVAAAVVAAAGLGAAIVAPPPSSPTFFMARVYRTAAGERQRITLGDGTRVTLAPASELLVPWAFGAMTRTVALRGEGFFAVVHDAARPFAVRA